MRIARVPHFIQSTVEMKIGCATVLLLLYVTVAYCQTIPAFPKLPLLMDTAVATTSAATAGAPPPGRSTANTCIPGPSVTLRTKKAVRLFKNKNGYQDIFAGEQIEAKDVFIHYPSAGIKPLSYIENKVGNAYFKFLPQFYLQRTVDRTTAYIATSKTNAADTIFVKTGNTYDNLNGLSTYDEPIHLNKAEVAGKVRFAYYYDINSPSTVSSSNLKFCLYAGSPPTALRYLFVDTGYLSLKEVEVSGANEEPSIYHYDTLTSSFSFAETDTNDELFIRLKGQDRYIPLSRVKYTA